jgi:hypothetical protein
MSLVSEQHSMRNPRAVLHWYDFLCPFCYSEQSRNAVLVQHGFHLVELTFQRFTPKFHTAGFRRNCTFYLYPLRGCLRAFPGRSRYWIFIVRAVRRQQISYPKIASIIYLDYFGFSIIGSKFPQSPHSSS